tara:strand:- start:615 stop:1772 length:1158 start_codon:yes stop_codon:yes gene_type:complete
MGLFSKVWKGLKKTVKKIGKGVKKVFKKVGAAIGKLGIVGQIGMMFLMPYATSALGSFFGASGKLATWSTKLLGKAGIGSKAIGHTLNLVNKAGTFVGNVYNSISSTISNAIDKTGNFLKGRGFVSTEQFTRLNTSIANQLDASKINIGDENFNLFDKNDKLIFDTGKQDMFKLDTSTLKFDSAGQYIPQKPGNLLDMGTEDLTNFLTSKENISKSLKFATDKGMVSDIGSLLSADTNPLSSPPSNLMDTILDKGKDFLQEGKDRAIDSAYAGFQMSVKQGVAEKLGYTQPEGPDYYNINLPGLMDRTATNYSVFDEVNLMSQKIGNNSFVSNIQNSNYLNSLIDDTPAYQSYMSQNSSNMYSTNPANNELFRGGAVGLVMGGIG